MRVKYVTFEGKEFDTLEKAKESEQESAIKVLSVVKRMCQKVKYCDKCLFHEDGTCVILTPLSPRCLTPDSWDVQDVILSEVEHEF